MWSEDSRESAHCAAEATLEFIGLLVNAATRWTQLSDLRQANDECALCMPPGPVSWQNEDGNCSRGTRNRSGAESGDRFEMSSDPLDVMNRATFSNHSPVFE
jgi:hypothetical protein